MKKLQLTDNKWRPKNNRPLNDNSFTKQITSNPIGQQLINDRFHSIDQFNKYINPSIDHLYNPYLLHDMKKAVTTIKQAIKENKKIIIYGDYDVDGITSTAIMYETLKTLGAKHLDYYIPNRFTDGYGPNLDRYKQIVQKGYQLLITVDNGIAAPDIIKYATDHGMQVVITDHHEMQDKLPIANALVHPELNDYPFKGLCGAGVAFKTASALLGQIPFQMLDLVTLGTIADVMEMNSENHILVSYGLNKIVHTTRPGLQQLLQAEGITQSKLTTTDLSFSVIPVINSTGRIASGKIAFNFLTNKNPNETIKYVNQAEQLNIQRKSLTDKYEDEALSNNNDLTHDINVVIGQNWHQGIAGIVAGQLTSKTGHSTIVLSDNTQSQIATGSGRATPGIPLLKYIMPYKKLTERFGGHNEAFGLSVSEQNLPAYKKAIESIKLDPKETKTKDKLYETDLDLNYCDQDLIKAINACGPFGNHNYEPKFHLTNFKVTNISPMGAKNNNLSVSLVSQNGHFFRAIKFRVDPETTKQLTKNQNPPQLELIGHPSINYYRGNAKIQIMIDDFAIK